MLKQLSFIFFVLIGLAGVNSCSTDVDLYADYKEITVVYGILDIDDDTSWLKITRAFSGPGNALVLAQNPDSNNFPYKLDVTITGEKQGETLPAIAFDTITIKDKKAGDSIFYYPDQLVYFTTGSFDKDASYSLLIKTNENEITSQTELIGDFNITSPRNRINFDTDNVKFEWNTPKNGKRYELSYVFHYQELQPGNPDTLTKSMYWEVGDEVSESTDGAEQIEVTGYDGNRFFDKLENNLPDENDIPGIKRWAGNVDVIVASGTQELQNYLAINSVEGSLLEEVPVYTNIANGTGLFAARHTAVKSVQTSTITLNRLVDMDLGFQLPQ